MHRLILIYLLQTTLTSSMATSTSIPPDLTYADIVQGFDCTFNSDILFSLLHGMYIYLDTGYSVWLTIMYRHIHGIVAVTLWNICGENMFDIILH